MLIMSTSPAATKQATRASASKVMVAEVVRRQSIANLSDDQARTLGKAAGRQAFDSALDAGLAVPMLSAGKLTTRARTAS